MADMTGKFILVIGPSGSGKGTLIGHIRPLFPILVYPRSTTTRAMRASEKDGEHYYFISADQFMTKAHAGEFLEWAEYGGHLYGTLRSEVMPILEAGKVALKELEVQGARQVREKLPREALAIIFVNAGAWDEMEQRIKARAPISDEELSRRKERYEDEMSFMAEADYVVENHSGSVEEAKKNFEGIVRSILGS